MDEGDERLRNILEKRSDVLRYLLDSPARKPELVRELPISRSTVDRAIRDLIAVNCVTADGGEYEATTTGRLAVAEYTRYETTTTAITRSSELLNCLPETAHIDPVLLDDASITVADPHAPDQALAPTNELIEEATELRGLAPVVRKSYLTTISNQLDREEFTVEIVAEQPVVSAMSDYATDVVAPLREHDSVTLYRTDTQLPYALWVTDGPSGAHAGITVYNSGGVAGTIVNDTTEAVEWARDRYRTFRKQARPVSLSAIHPGSEK